MKKTAIITGASSGIGAATVELLLSKGWEVYACARRQEHMAGLAAKGAVTLKLDITQDESLCAVVETVLRQSGRIDALVNNAGYGSYGALEDVSMDEARRQFEVNVFGLARLTQLVVPSMRSHGAGRVVNITSIGGKIHEPLGSWYHATKFAVEGMSDCLRMELKPFGIDVIVIEPGAIRTGWSPIAQQKVLEFSGATAYAEQARQRVAMLAYADRTASDPSLVAETILRALTASNPATRYAVGRGAFFMLLLRWLLPDRAFDAFMELVTKRLAESGQQPAA